MAQMDWIALILVIVAALAGPYVIGAARMRLTHPKLPMRLYAPHLVLLSSLGIAPVLRNGVPAAGVTFLAFTGILSIWALCVVISEWHLRRLRAKIL